MAAAAQFSASVLFEDKLLHRQLKYVDATGTDLSQVPGTVERASSTLNTWYRTARVRTRDAPESVIQAATEWISEPAATKLTNQCFAPNPCG